MKLFTVGPVEMYPETLAVEGMQNPYFRTTDFGQKMIEVENDFLASIHAPAGAKFSGLTCSGTGAMEAAVTNCLTSADKVLVINGGSFGNRFAQMCGRYGIPHEEYVIPYGEAFSKEKFSTYGGKGYTALLVNVSETSTSQLYDLDFLGEFCRNEGMYLIVDAVSAYLADPIDMERQGIDVLLTASQKALALSPGVALIAMSERIYEERVSRAERVFYFDLKDYVENQKRGQPPFTSAVGTMLALHRRLSDIQKNGGVREENRRHKERAEYFRRLAEDLPVRLPSFPMSSSCTAVLFPEENADLIYDALMRKYGLILTPSGGDWKKKQLRVGHLGNLQLKDYDFLIEKMRAEL